MNINIVRCDHELLGDGIMADSREVLRTIRADRSKEFGFPQIVSPVHLSGSSRSPTPAISRFDLLLHEKVRTCIVVYRS